MDSFLQALVSIITRGAEKEGTDKEMIQSHAFLNNPK